MTSSEEALRMLANYLGRMVIRAGEPSARDLARKASLSHTTVSDALGAKRLVGRDSVQAIAEALTEDEPHRRNVLRLWTHARLRMEQEASPATWFDLGDDDLNLYGMEVLVRVQTRHRDGTTMPLVYHRIDPRCVSFTVEMTGASRMDIDHYESCRCGVQPLRALKITQLDERGEPLFLTNGERSSERAAVEDQEGRGDQVE